MASSPELPSGETRASSPSTSCGIATHAQKGGERLRRIRRERTLRSTRENQGGNTSSTLDTGRNGDLISDVTVQVLQYSSLHLLYTTSLGGDIPLGLNGVDRDWPQTRFLQEEAIYFLRSYGKFSSEW